MGYNKFINYIHDFSVHSIDWITFKMHHIFHGIEGNQRKNAVNHQKRQNCAKPTEDLALYIYIQRDEENCVKPIIDRMFH